MSGVESCMPVLLQYDVQAIWRFHKSKILHDVVMLTLYQNMLLLNLREQSKLTFRFFSRSISA